MSTISDHQPRASDGNHLTREQVATIEAYMREILNRLDLGYWRVYVATDLPPEYALLMIEVIDRRRIAMLYVSEDWWDKADDHRTDMTHEALHLAHHDQDECIRRFFNETGDVAEYVGSLVVGQFKVETERMVDSLSYVLAPHMPEWQRSTDQGDQS